MERLMALPGIMHEDQIDANDGNTKENWIVTVFDNDVNTEDEVIDVLVRATSCPVAEAEMETWEIHHLGKSVVHQGAKGECDQSATIISQIGIRVEVSQE